MYIRRLCVQESQLIRHMRTKQMMVSACAAQETNATAFARSGYGGDEKNVHICNNKFASLIMCIREIGTLCGGCSYCSNIWVARKHREKNIHISRR